jgi:hypothetical protein
MGHVAFCGRSRGESDNQNLPAGLQANKNPPTKWVMHSAPTAINTAVGVISLSAVEGDSFPVVSNSINTDQKQALTRARCSPKWRDVRVALRSGSSGTGCAFDSRERNPKPTSSSDLRQVFS